MPTKFLESLGGKLAEQWGTNLLTPAFAFWLGGFIAWINHFGWNWLSLQFMQLVEPLQIAALVGALFIVVVSAFAIQQLDLAVLRLFEGYWHSWFNAFRRKLINRQKCRFDRLSDQWQKLQLKQDQAQLTSAEQDRLSAIDWQLRQFPTQRDRFMPTQFGNLLRAAESQSKDKYGLDAIICWSRLWFVLPDGVKKDLQEARADLNCFARLWLWGILFLIWSVWAIWAVPIGLGIAWFAHRGMLVAAATYGDLLESAFDLYRFDLYRSLHLPTPSNPAEERQFGQQLTQYLWRGSDRAHPIFTNSQFTDSKNKP